MYMFTSNIWGLVLSLMCSTHALDELREGVGLEAVEPAMYFILSRFSAKAGFGRALVFVLSVSEFAFR